MRRVPSPAVETTWVCGRCRVNQEIHIRLSPDCVWEPELVPVLTEEPARDALRKLANEVRGWLDLKPVQLAGILGNTNVAVMRDKLAEADSVTSGTASPVAPAKALLADVMHLWLDGYISKNPKSCADDSVSDRVFEKVSNFLQAEGIEVDYCGWRKVQKTESV